MVGECLAGTTRGSWPRPRRDRRDAAHQAGLSRSAGAGPHARSAGADLRDRLCARLCRISRARRRARCSRGSRRRRPGSRRVPIWRCRCRSASAACPAARCVLVALILALCGYGIWYYLSTDEREPAGARRRRPVVSAAVNANAGTGAAAGGAAGVVQHGPVRSGSVRSGSAQCDAPAIRTSLGFTDSIARGAGEIADSQTPPAPNLFGAAASGPPSGVAAPPSVMVPSVTAPTPSASNSSAPTLAPGTLITTMPRTGAAPAPQAAAPAPAPAAASVQPPAAQPQTSAAPASASAPANQCSFRRGRRAGRDSCARRLLDPGAGGRTSRSSSRAC